MGIELDPNEYIYWQDLKQQILIVKEAGQVIEDKQYK